MPAPESVTDAASRLGRAVEIDEISSNETLEARMRAGQPFDLVFPSDYLVERLASRGSLLELERDSLPLQQLAAWARDAEHDRGCRWSVPFAYGTTGYLCDERTVPPPSSWAALFNPAAGARVGMLDELREVVGAALIAAGWGPNDVSDKALGAARQLLERQRPHVARYDSDDFVGPVVTGSVGVHQAWSGPASHAVRHSPVRLRYVVPEEGAILWITAAAIPADAPDPALSLRMLRRAAGSRTSGEHDDAPYGYATPSDAARSLSRARSGDDPSLFPDADTLARCHVFRDAGAEEHRFADAWVRGVTDRR